MKRLLLVVVVLALAVGGYYYYNYLRDTPVSALMQATRATQTHDLVAFERFVDIDAMTSSAVNELASQSTVLTSLVPGGGLILRGGLSLLKPQLTKAAHVEMRRFVETGSIEDAETAAPRRLVNVSFLGIVGRILGPQSSFKGIKYTTEKGDDAWVGLELSQPRYDTTIVVEVMLRRQQDGRWQAKRISNVDKMLKQVARLEKARILK